MVHLHGLLTGARFLQLNSVQNKRIMTEYTMDNDIFPFYEQMKTKFGYKNKLTAHVKRRLTFALSFPVFANYKRKYDPIRTQIIYRSHQTSLQEDKMTKLILSTNRFIQFQQYLTIH